MGIKSTRYITREAAIARIKGVHSLATDKNYRELEFTSHDPNCDIELFVEEEQNFDISNIIQWTDEMLGNKMDEPFYRWSIFDNYLIKREEA